MFRKLALLLALFPTLALGQNLYRSQPTWQPPVFGFYSPGAIAGNATASSPLSLTGSGFDCGGAISCVSFDGRQNLLKQSENLAVTWVPDPSVVVTPNQCLDLMGQATLESVDNTAAAAPSRVVYQAVTVPSSTGPWTVSWDVSASDGHVVSPGAYVATSTPQTCSCTRSDGLPCTAQITGITCYAPVVATPAVRVNITMTSAAPVTLVGALFAPGNYTSTKAVACAGRAQVNYGAPVTYAQTTTQALSSVPLDSGLSWAVNGTPAAVQSTALPTTVAQGAVGPFSDVNYFSSGSGSDPLDSTGDRFGCVAFVPTGNYPAFQYLLSNGQTTVAGYYIGLNATTGSVSFGTATPVTVTTTSSTLPVGSALNVACWWRTGAAIFAKVNLGTTATTPAAGTEVAGDAISLKIGRANTAGASFPGQILGVVQGLGACPTPPAPFAATCEGWATYQMSRQFGLLGNQFTRATSATNEMNFSKIDGPLLSSDANTVSHVYWTGNGIADLSGVPWTLNGTVPLTGHLNSPWGAGPYSASANFYSTPDVGDFAQDWNVTAVVSVSSLASSQTIVGKVPGTNNAGWAMQMASGTGGINCYVYDGAWKAAASGTGVSVSGINVVTCGKSGSTIYSRVNSGATGTVAIGTMTQPTGSSLQIGKYGPGLGLINGIVYEVLASTTPYSDSLHIARYNEVMSKAWLPTYIWSVPAGTPMVNTFGTGVFQGATNTAVQSENTCSAGAVVGPWINPGAIACTADAATSPAGTLTADQWVGSGAGSYIYQSAPFATASATGTASAWAWKASGSGAASVGVQCAAGTVLSCTCFTSDGSPCATTLASPNCWARATGVGTGTAPTRIQAQAVCAAPTISWLVLMAPGNYGVATGTSYLWGAQLEPGYSATPYVPTTAATATRNADVLAIPNTIQSSDNTWCTSGLVTPYGRTWANWDGFVNTLWSAGTTDMANSTRTEIEGGQLKFKVFDYTDVGHEVTYVLPASLVGQHEVKTCVAKGRLAMYLDGSLVSVGAIPTDPSFGVWLTAPSTFTLGARTGNTNYLNGYVENFAIKTNEDASVDISALDALAALSLPMTQMGIGFDVPGPEHNLLTYSNVTRLALSSPPPGVIDAPGQLSPYFLGSVKVVNDGGTNTAYKAATLALNQYYIGSFFVRMEDGGVPVIGNNTAAGDFTIVIDGNLASNIASFIITPLGGGVYRVSAQRQATVGGTRFFGVVKYASQSKRAFFLDGFQANVATSPTDYVPTAYVPTGATAATTFTASNLTFDGRHNYALQSQALNLSWAASSVTVSAGGVKDPWGGTASWLVTASAGSAEHGVTQTAAGFSTSNTWSIYAKPGTHNYVTFRGTGGTRKGTFNIATCTESAASANTALSATLDPVTGWCRISASGDYSSGGFGAWDITDSTGTLTYNATGTETVYLTGGQFNDGAVALAYTPTTTTARTSVPFDQKGLNWTVNGSPLSVQGGVLPTTATPGAAGPFSDTDYYSYGTGVDPLDSTGDRWGCVAFVPASITGTTSVLISNGTNGAAGYYVRQSGTTGAFSWISNGPTGIAVDTGNSVTVNGYNVGCWWRTETTISAKLNLGTTVNQPSGGTEVAGTGYSPKVGRYESIGNSYSGQILGIVQGLGSCPTPPSAYPATCEGWATYQMERQFGMYLPQTGTRLTMVRATPATNEVNSKIWNIPNNIPRIGANGLLVERAVVNSVLQSSTSCVGNAVQAPWTVTGTPTCTSDDQVAPDGTTTMDTWTSVGVTDTIRQTVTTSSSTTFVASVWARKSSSGAATQFVRCSGTTTTACACGATDGSACSVSGVGSSDCVATYTAVSATRPRLLVSATCAAAITGPVQILSPGNYNVATGTTSFWGAQVEPGTVPSSYIPTTTVATTRNTDVISTAWPVTPDTNKWCVKTVTTPFGGKAWDYTYGEVWAAGTAAAVNSSRLIFSSGNLSYRIYDATGAVKIVVWAPNYAVGSTHTIHTCNDSGTMSIYSDGVLVSGGPSGVGTGTWTVAPSLYYVGNMSSGANGGDSFSRNVTVCPSADPKLCR